MARVLEISRVPLFKHCYPADTTWFNLGVALTVGNEGLVPEPWTVRNVWRLVRELRRGSYDLVILPAVEIAYAHDPRRLKRWLRRLVGAAASTRLAAAVLEGVCRWRHNAVIFEDLSDTTQMSYEVCALVPGFRGYFKREFDPERTLRPGPRWQGINERVWPWSLFLPTTNLVPDATEKKSDVFFAGQCHNPVRREGLPQLRRLAERGYRIDAPEDRLTYAEYLQRMAEAWLVWSPEGYGWDCYRHYEAAFAGTVPVINEPATNRVRPFEDGVQCFYYRPEADGLEQTIVRALADRPRLQEMAARGRERVLTRYTREAMVAAMQAAVARGGGAEGPVSA